MVPLRPRRGRETGRAGLRWSCKEARGGERQERTERQRQDRRAAGRGQEPASPGLGDTHSPRGKG